VIQTATPSPARADTRLTLPAEGAQTLHPRTTVEGKTSLGAVHGPRGTTFGVFTTEARAVAVRLFDGDSHHDVALEDRGDGFFAGTVDGVEIGALYKLVLDGDELPDPYARSLPFGVHGPARVVATVNEPALADPPRITSIYELHVGTFTPEGTFRAAIEKLDALVDLGVSAIELLPVAAFDGERGWGYDGVALYAPFAAYGEPDDLRELVRAAHARGLAVILDVVYNHFGPAGNYLSRYAKGYFTTDVKTPWGDAPDFAHAPMRRLVLENARYWLAEYGFDGLRLDATHEIVDPSDDRHILAEIVTLAHAMTPPRKVFFEDERNDPKTILRAGADGVWADDLHHQLHVLATGERDGYYGAYEPTVAELARCIREGWSYSGQPYAPWDGRVRGAPATALRPEQLVTCIQNHDQVGNRALGTRLSADAGVDRFALAAMVLLFLPTTAVLFMGQEWAASTPFLFFSDHEGELGEAVTKGRRKEFERFASFAHADIPDPQARDTFERSKLRWDERTTEPHARILALHRTMLSLRREDPVLAAPADWRMLDARADGHLLEVVRRREDRTRRLLANAGDAERSIEIHAGERVVAASGRHDASKLGPFAAIVVARD
jgi:maltooligosyltrehalose trehalohydrolase